jgi:outer membrane receptor protein involved in Fe transport
MWIKTLLQRARQNCAIIQRLFILTADRRSNSSNSSNWNTTGFDAKGTVLKNYPQLTAITGGNQGQQITAQLDFTNPINDSTKLEMGLRSNTNLRTQATFFNQFDYITHGYVQNNLLSINADITDMVNAGYITYSSRLKYGISYQAGLRYEQSKLTATSKLSDLPSFGYDFTGNLGNSLFPSLYLSKKLDASSEIQLNYSRKIQRPNFMQLMPIVQSSDPQNIRIGNPALQPEFVNLSELNYNKHFGANNWLVSAYFMLETNTIKPFASPSPTDASVLITTFKNMNNETRYGLDNTLKLSLTKEIDFTPHFNIYNLTITNNDLLSVNGWAYDAKASLNYKMPYGFSAQLNGNYESKRVIPQGTQLATAYADFAVKKSFFKGAANATFSINDIFDSRKNVVDYNFPTFTQETMRRRDMRYYQVSVQIPFGKANASLFRKKSDKKPQDGQPEMDF